MARTGHCERATRRCERLQPLSAVHEFPSRVKCATLPWRALLAALDGERRRPVSEATCRGLDARTARTERPTEDAIIAAIGTVYDPEIPVNIYELGLIYAIDIADDGRSRSR